MAEFNRGGGFYVAAMAREGQLGSRDG